jgi:DNA repair protein RadA/Sms
MDNVIDFASQIASEGNPPRAIVIDSIQTMVTTDLSGMAGSVGQVRECAFRLVKLAKSTGIPVFVVGHVTKEGTVAGPAVLMHIVDTVLWFEGDKTLTTRILRAVKNRFGPTDEVGIFIMEDRGLVSESDPEKIFLNQSKKNMSGSVITSVLEGTRPILVEIQSLVVSTKLPIPRRIGQGIDSKKLELLLAVLTRRCNLPLYEYDCFLNVAGGISIRNDPSTDLAICLSVASSYFDRPLEARSVALGEVGLLGDIREVIAQEKRVKEAKRLGYRNVITNKEANYLGNAIKKYLR